MKQLGKKRTIGSRKNGFNGNQWDDIPAYKLKLSCYTIPPVEETIGIEEWNQFAIDRLKVLMMIDDGRISGMKGRPFYDKLRNFVNKYLPLKTVEDIRKDVISHWTLRLAYVNDPKWLISREAELFKFRLKDTDIFEFLRKNNMHYQRITAQEFKELRNNLHDVIKYSKKGRQRDAALHPDVSNARSYFKLPFEDALYLLSRQSVLLIGGWAYVHMNDLVPIITAEFRQHLEEGMIAAEKRISKVNQDPRFRTILTELPQQFASQEFTDVQITGSRGKINMKEIDALATRSYPLCMKTMHDKLRTRHHLKHGGRLQYGLFLKGIGVTLDQAVTFWRHEFLKRMSSNEFQRDHLYNIRHNYGKEGKGVSYTPHSCFKIIMGDVKAGEDHGCPFRHFNKEKLSASLRKEGATTMEIQGIIREVDNENYGHACRGYFGLKHKGANIDEVAINHPMQYYTSSLDFHEKKDEMRMDQ